MSIGIEIEVNDKMLICICISHDNTHRVKGSGRKMLSFVNLIARYCLRSFLCEECVYDVVMWWWWCVCVYVCRWVVDVRLLITAVKLGTIPMFIGLFHASNTFLSRSFSSYHLLPNR